MDQHDYVSPKIGDVIAENANEDHDEDAVNSKSINVSPLQSRAIISP